jgi:hypothetical protein
MADRAPFKSVTTDYIGIRKRAEELGFIKPSVEEKSAPVESNAPINVPEHDENWADYSCGLNVGSAELVERELYILRSRGLLTSDEIAFLDLYR